MSTHSIHWGRPQRHVRDGERGSVSVELAVVFPLFLLVLLTAVQAAVWWHARNLCLAAARTGATAGRALNAGDARAREAAATFARRTGHGALAGLHVSTAGSTSTAVRVTVSGVAPRVVPIPGLEFRVTQSAVAGRESFSTPEGTP